MDVMFRYFRVARPVAVIHLCLEFGVCCGFCVVHWPAFEYDIFGQRIGHFMSKGQDYEIVMKWVDST